GPGALGQVTRAGGVAGGRGDGKGQQGQRREAGKKASHGVRVLVAGGSGGVISLGYCRRAEVARKIPGFFLQDRGAVRILEQGKSDFLDTDVTGRPLPARAEPLAFRGIELSDRFSEEESAASRRKPL